MTRTTQDLDSILDDVFDSRDVIERFEELNDAAAEEPTDLGCSYCGEGSMPDADAPSLCTEH